MKPRKPRISDEHLLDLIECGDIVVDLETGDCWFKGQQKKATLMGSEDANGTRYRYEFRLEGFEKRTIVRSKLVYMAGALKVVPEGHEIHHVDDDRYHDQYSNLVCVTKEDHLKLHGKYNLTTVPF